MQIIVDDVLGRRRCRGGCHRGEMQIDPELGFVCLLLAIHFLRGGLSAWSTTYLVRAGLRMTHELRLRVYEHLQKLSSSFTTSAQLAIRSTGDVGHVFHPNAVQLRHHPTNFVSDYAGWHDGDHAAL
jgi:hypothetical protein